jgi:hypothetical protein
MSEAAHEEIEVAATPSRCFALATAFEEYPTWASDVREIAVLARDELGRGTRVEFHVAGLGRRIRYVLDYDYREAPDAFTWSLVEGDMLRTLDGRYGFTPTDGGTRIDYSLAVDLSVPVPGLFKRRASGMIMANALRDLRRAVEQDMTDDDITPDPFLHLAAEAPSDVPAGPRSDLPPEPRSSASHAEAVGFEEAGTEQRPLPPPSILESVITELLGAVPEVRDHVLEAAEALLDAAKALVDAADRVVRQQRGEE